MKVAVVGYGRMGREVEAVLRERAHEPSVVRRGETFPARCDVGIDFTRADVVLGNLESALAAGARYVVGTTGWSDRESDARRAVERAAGGLVHGANFSLGVHLFYEIVRQAGALVSRFPDYDPYILEKHHRGKRDAPSGTASALARILAGSAGARTRAATSLEGSLPADSFHVASVRAGGIVGEHLVGFDSGGDEILLEHRARSRRGFALGAVLAAEWIATRSGFHPFSDVIADLIQP
jgi:4-hydroxy-tetrahydrodipicolinate reductase